MKGRDLRRSFAIVNRLCSFMVSFVCSIFAYGQGEVPDVIKIGIGHHLKPTSAQVITEFGMYNVWADGKRIAQLQPRDRITFIKRGGHIEVSLPGKILGNYRVVEVKALGDDCVFRLYLLKPTRHERVYDDDLYLTVWGDGPLKFVNRLQLEKYIAGVVEAESGKEKGLEYYRVQAIISRTYALSNQRRYLQEGFHLNDRVDCQVYEGKARWEPDILKAVDDTRGLVLVDSEMQLINAAFHSNSGGETVASEAVWSRALPYLIARRDDFSLHGAHFAWERTLGKQQWLDYLRNKYGYDTANPTLLAHATAYEQPSRELYMVDPAFKIPLKEVRKDWGFQSTWFDITEAGDSLRFIGRGFGHGVGLSQEGAMRMTELGFKYDEILHYYYNDVHLIDLHNLGFYIEE